MVWIGFTGFNIYLGEEVPSSGDFYCYWTLVGQSILAIASQVFCNCDQFALEDGKILKIHRVL
jgi:hypothetical protein